jgi:hypothetical protein
MIVDDQNTHGIDPRAASVSLLHRVRLHRRRREADHATPARLLYASI